MHIVCGDRAHISKLFMHNVSFCVKFIFLLQQVTTPSCRTRPFSTPSVVPWSLWPKQQAARTSWKPSPRISQALITMATMAPAQIHHSTKTMRMNMMMMSLHHGDGMSLRVLRPRHEEVRAGQALVVAVGLAVQGTARLPVWVVLCLLCRICPVCHGHRRRNMMSPISGNRSFFSVLCCLCNSVQ